MTVLINSYQSGILLNIKRKLELNMYLDVRFYLKCLPFFLFVRKQPPKMLCGSECFGGFCRGFAGELLCRGLFFNKIAGLWLWCGCLFFWVLRDFWEHLFYRALLDDCFCLFHLWYLANSYVKEKYITRYNLVYNLYVVCVSYVLF